MHASLTQNVTNTPDLTIFAPSNAALTALGATLEDMSIAESAEVLSYHIVTSSYSVNLDSSGPFVGYSPNLANGTILRTAQGANVSITKADNSLFANSARVIQAEILIPNGVLHAIDNVLDYNATNGLPDPALGSQMPVLQGSALDGDTVPFTQYLPASTSASLDVSEATSMTSATQAAMSSFGIDDIGKGGRDVVLSEGGDGGVRTTGIGNGGRNLSTNATRTANSPTTAVMNESHRGEEIGLGLALAAMISGFLML